MEEFILLLVAVVLGFAGLAWGLIEAGIAWFQAACASRESAPDAGTAESREPSEPSYFFSMAWRDWLEIVRASGQQVRIGARRHLDHRSDGVLEAFHKCAGGAMFCAAPFWIALFSGLHGAGLAACLLGLLPLLGLFRAVGAGRHLLYRLSSPCPRCHYRSSLPAFRCDGEECDRVHRHLVPGRYGLFSHRCLCGSLLPANFWNGRERLKAVCPECGSPRTAGASTPLCLALGGGTSNGKTHFLARALLDLFEEEAPALGWRIQPTTPGDEAALEALLGPYRGGAVGHTPAIVPSALSLTLTLPGVAVPWEVLLYDPGGESFQTGGGLEQHVYYQFINGAVFVIDPFAAPALAERHRAALDQAGCDIRPGNMDLGETFGMMSAALMRSGQARQHLHFSIPMAVVVSKLDAFDLVADFAATDGPTVNSQCRNFLEATGVGHLVGKIASTFPVCRCFPSGEFRASAFKSASRVFSDGRVLSWLLREADPRLKSATAKGLGAALAGADGIAPVARPSR